MLRAELRKLTRSAGGATKLPVSNYADITEPRVQSGVVSTTGEHTALFPFHVCEKSKISEVKC